MLLAIAPPAQSRATLSPQSLKLEFNDARFAENNDPSSTNNPSSTLGDNGTSWLEAVFENGETNSVKLTLDANLDNDSGAFISSVAFNLGENTNISSVCIVESSSCVTQGFTYDPDGINMSNGISGLDLRLNFPTGNNDRLDLNNPLSFIITGDNLDFESFNNFIDIGGEEVYAAARLQGYGGSSTIYSAPGPLPLLGIAAAFRTSRRLRRRLRRRLASSRLASGRPPAHRPA